MRCGAGAGPGRVTDPPVGHRPCPSHPLQIVAGLLPASRFAASARFPLPPRRRIGQGRSRFSTTHRVVQPSFADMARQPTGLGYFAMRAANAIDSKGSAPSRSHTPARLRCTPLPHTEAALLTSTASLRPGRPIRQHKLFGVTMVGDGCENARFARHRKGHLKSC